MAGKLEQLKQVLGSGARPNKYRVVFEIPQAIPKDIDSRVFDVLCKSSSFPERNIGIIEVWSQGRKLPLRGDTSYSNSWTLTFYNNESHDVRRAFLEWMRSIDHFQDNIHSGVPSEIMTTMQVHQLDSSENITISYHLHNCWPSQVSEIQLGDDQQDQVQEFTVNITFSDFVVGEDGMGLDKPLEYHKATRNRIA